MKRSRRCAALFLALLFGACSHKTPSPPAQDASAPSQPAEQQPAGSQPGPPARPAPAELWKEFSGTAAFEHVRRLVDLGPRPSGSEAVEKARRYITSAVQAAGWRVEPQKFVDLTPRGPVTFVNLIARFGNGRPGPVSEATQRVVIASHYDTKIFDTIQFVGADDGGSSTGALIELARVLALDPDLARRVELVFFDGEEAVVQFTDLDGLYGSRYYARALRETKRNWQFKFGILWDMIGPTDLNITIPPDSPTDLARNIFAAADVLGVRKNFSYFRGPVLDDHTPLNESHIPTIDLIDFDFVYWHTADDTMDKLSPESLRTVGEVTLYVLRHADIR